MSIEGQLRSQAWHLPEGFDTAKALMFSAADELAALRAAAAERDELKRTVQAQAAQLEQARKLINIIQEMADNGTSAIDIDPSSPLWQIEADTRAWLAANAPQDVNTAA